jgi:mannose-6-phosphate isomerase
MMSNYGGNRVRTMDLDQWGRQDFAQSPYVYFYYKARPQEKLVLKELRSFSVYVYGAKPSTVIEIDLTGKRLSLGDMVQVENQELTLSVSGAEAQLLVAGVKCSVSETPYVTLTKAAAIKRVNKPWGFELWINGEHPGYALKHICINPGNRTSLQYHHFKQETNVLMKGQAKCSFKQNAGIANDDVKESDIGYFQIKAVAVLDIQPEIIHRIESLTAITLCEVSTPHLDDVIRVFDDAKRSDGRIAQEHQ